MNEVNQNKLPDAFGDLVASSAYSKLTGIEQKTLENQASLHNALFRIGEVNYIRLSTLLLGQLDKIVSPDQSRHAILNDTDTINTIDSIGRLRGITHRLSLLSAPKEIELIKIFSKMLQEDDPGKRLELAHEYGNFYSQLVADLETIRKAEDRLQEVIPKEKKRVDSFLENRKREGTMKKKPPAGAPSSVAPENETSVIDEWTTIGQINVDSGCVMIFDPCHFHSDIQPIQEIVHGFHRGHQIGDNIAVIIPTAFGDGVYNVEALIGKVRDFGEMIKEIRVRFVGPGTMYSF